MHQYCNFFSHCYIVAVRQLLSEWRKDHTNILTTITKSEIKSIYASVKPSTQGPNVGRHRLIQLKLADIRHVYTGVDPTEVRGHYRKRFANGLQISALSQTVVF